MSDHDARTLHSAVRDHYGAIATRSGDVARASALSRATGYSEADLESAPAESNLGLGCGNPIALASLRPGETVLDLGSGAGFDAFLAARAVGPEGRVIGVDMTDAMIEKARANAQRIGAQNVEFRMGQIEALPLEDRCVDVVLSNCVINLSPDKPRVFAEAFRVLRPGGRLMVSDLVATGALPASVRTSVEAIVGCVGGIRLEAEYLDMLRDAGFAEVETRNRRPAADILGTVNLDAPTGECATQDPVIQELLGQVGTRVPIADALRAIQLVTSAGFRATKPRAR